MLNLQNGMRDLLLIPHFISLTNETFLVAFTHMSVQLITTKETLSTEFTHWVNTGFDLFLWWSGFMGSEHGREVERQLVGCVEDMFMSKNLLESNTYVAEYHLFILVF